MKTVTTIGIDLAKNSFSIYGVNAMGKPVLSRTLSRAGVVRFFANLPAALWAWRLARLRSTGPEPLKASAMRCDAFIPRYVKAYLLGAKNDANNAAGHLRGRAAAKHAFRAAQITRTDRYSMYSPHPARIRQVSHSPC